MLINGAAYTWSDIKVNMLGRDVQGITAVKYGRKRNKTNNYGAGSKPVSRGKGNVEFDCSITMEMKEVVALRAAAREKYGEGAGIDDIAATPIVIQFANNENQIVTVTLENAEFLEDITDSKQGDTSIEIELPLIVSDIKEEVE